MKYKETIDCHIWSEPDEQHRVKEIGMRTYGEVFDELKTKLKQAGLLPDDYFLLNTHLDRDTPMVDFSLANCNVNFGGGEGIYLDIDFIYRNAAGQKMPMHFATGKTLGENTNDFYTMSVIAGECSMLLNGGGYKIRDNTKSVLILGKNEAEELKNAFAMQAGFNEALNRSNETLFGLIEEVYGDEIHENEDDLEDAL